MWWFECAICLSCDFNPEQTGSNNRREQNTRNHSLITMWPWTKYFTCQNLSFFFFFILSFPKTCIKSVLFWVLESETRKTRWPLWVSAVVCVSDWGVREPGTGHFWFACVLSRAALSLDPCLSEGIEDWQASDVPCTSSRHFPMGNLLLLAQLLNCLTPLRPMGWEGLPVHLYWAHLSWLIFNLVFQLWKTSIWMAVIGNLIIFWCFLWCLENPLRMVYIFSAFPHSVLKLYAKNSAWILFFPFLFFFSS